MKVLIWIGCLVLNYIIQCISSALVSCLPASNATDAILIGLLNGILSAASIGFCIWLALKFCNKFDLYKAMKKAAEAEMTISEYGRQGLSAKFLAKLEELSSTVPHEQVKFELKACLKKGIITKEQYIILIEEYCKKK